MTSQSSTDRWTINDAIDLYDTDRWGNGYFSVNSLGHVSVHPTKDPEHSLDLKELVERLELRGLDLPLLIRFNGIVKDRLQEIHGAFAQAIQDNEYTGRYVCIYPVKVNQQRQVVEQVIRHGREYGFGLEAGSKPELLAVIAMAEGQTPIICNGFKDDEFVEMALLAQKLGRSVITVVEKYTELELVLKYAKKLNVRPNIGMRVKLASRGSGRWQMSGGFRSKFGLTVTEVLRGVELLREHQMLDCFKLLHFHLGSQITNIRHVKNALMEASRVYTDLVKEGAGLEFLDVGGGLGVDYDGSQTNFESSMNYTLQEYANDVVYHIHTACEEASIPHPHIITESGRAVVAYHSVLVFGALGVSTHTGSDEIDLTDVEKAEIEHLPQPLKDLYYTYENVGVRNVLEAYHDAQQSLEVSMNLFSAGHLSLRQRSLVEQLFWGICRKLQLLVRQLEFVPEELDGLDRLMAETYFGNFSLFQSVPDSWAIKQLFPVMPIHRLEEKPTHNAVIGDITCDSDGKMDRFIERRDIRRTLPLHALNDEPYQIGVFLVGAYQEILGDLHNLFGDTNMVHVNLAESGEVILETIIRGDTVQEVLDYVQFDEKDLVTQLQTAADVAVREGRLDHEEAGRMIRFYEAGLGGYTYLEKAGE